MTTIQASEAKTRLMKLLDEIETGAEYQITRHGRIIARLVPVPARREREIMQTIAQLRKLGRKNGAISPRALLSARNAGRKK